ncbi:MAG: glycine--tRNA ligase subunit beta, partial [Gammaproteobacteria bacterium]|nr:glycine--tRNA ligase subunit beta [Gammaproteobacteria bacterium]
RFHRPNPIDIPNPADYESLLEVEGHVLASFDRRKTAIKAQVEQAALSVSGTAVIDPDLLNEVTGLVEWPVAVIGDFDERFLEIPSEALISAMKGHQKYFHLVRDNDLLPNFITVANIDSKNIDTVRQGNERVIRPRLSDADFFWSTDRKTPLLAELKKLETVVFQKQLGTVLDKTKRVMSLSETIADTLDSNASHARRAAELSKCDLMTEMVGEFPELQGIMGRYYALHDNEAPEVAEAILEHYMPRFAGDDVPPSSTGQIVSIADKLDTLVGIFSIGQIPTGDKDPFALRRASLGVLRIMIEKDLPLDLHQLLVIAGKNYGNVDKAVIDSVFFFMIDRLKGYYHEQGIRPQVFEAVLGAKPTSPCDFDARIQAVAQFEKSSEAESLAAANKRINNILKKNKDPLPELVDANLFETDHEATLNNLLEVLKSDVNSFTEKHQYNDALTLLAQLKEPVDSFFDNVMVMADDKKIRNNRLILLSTMYQQFTKVADISKLS